MASSITIVERGVRNNKLWSRGTGNLGTYAAGGIAITANQVGMAVIDEFTLPGLGAADAGTTGYVHRWDATNGKMQAFEAGADGAPLDEAGTDDMSAHVFHWEAIGH